MTIKPTSLAIPLSSESHQPATVHHSWPITYVKRIFTLSTYIHQAEATANRFLANLKLHYTHPDIITAVKDKIGELAQNQRPTSKHHSTATPPPALWIPLPYHPVLHHVFTSTIQRCNTTETKLLWELAYQDTTHAAPPPKVGIAWKAMEPQMEGWIRSPKAMPKEDDEPYLVH